MGTFNQGVTIESTLEYLIHKELEKLKQRALEESFRDGTYGGTSIEEETSEE